MNDQRLALNLKQVASLASLVLCTMLLSVNISYSQRCPAGKTRKCSAGAKRDPIGCCVKKKRKRKRKKTRKKVCLAGQVKTEHSQGHCCWPGQSWSRLDKMCVGSPQCPQYDGDNDGLSPFAFADQCVCLNGREMGPFTQARCCWPGQEWIKGIGCRGKIKRDNKSHLQYKLDVLESVTSKIKASYKAHKMQPITISIDSYPENETDMKCAKNKHMLDIIKAYGIVDLTYRSFYTDSESKSDNKMFARGYRKGTINSSYFSYLVSSISMKKLKTLVRAYKVFLSRDDRKLYKRLLTFYIEFLEAFRDEIDDFDKVDTGWPRFFEYLEGYEYTYLEMKMKTKQLTKNQKSFISKHKCIMKDYTNYHSRGYLGGGWDEVRSPMRVFDFWLRRKRTHTLELVYELMQYARRVL